MDSSLIFEIQSSNLIKNFKMLLKKLIIIDDNIGNKRIENSLKLIKIRLKNNITLKS